MAVFFVAQANNIMVYHTVLSTSKTLDGCNTLQSEEVFED